MAHRGCTEDGVRARGVVYAVPRASCSSRDVATAGNEPHSSRSLTKWRTSGFDVDVISGSELRPASCGAASPSLRREQTVGAPPKALALALQVK